MSERDLLALPVALSDGNTVLIHLHRGKREEEVSTSLLVFTQAIGSVKSLIQDVILPLSEIEFDRLTIEVGIEFALEAGKLTSLVVSGSAKPSITIGVEFDRKKFADTAK